jgi:hypothetical protein
MTTSLIDKPFASWPTPLPSASALQPCSLCLDPIIRPDRRWYFAMFAAPSAGVSDAMHIVKNADRLNTPSLLFKLPTRLFIALISDSSTWAIIDK